MQSIYTLNSCYYDSNRSGAMSSVSVSTTRPLTVFEKTQKNQTDVRSSADLVSGFAPFQKKGEKGVTIEAESYDPFSEHATDILDRYDGQIGTDEPIHHRILCARISRYLSAKLDMFCVVRGNH